MLVAPLVSSTCSTPRRCRPPVRRVARRAISPPNPTANTAAVPRFLTVWLAIGVVVLLCVPAARSSTMFGATLPFWLSAAPLLDLVWLKRARLRSLLREQSGRMRRRRALLRR